MVRCCPYCCPSRRCACRQDCLSPLLRTLGDHVLSGLSLSALIGKRETASIARCSMSALWTMSDSSSERRKRERANLLLLSVRFRIHFNIWCSVFMVNLIPSRHGRKGSTAHTMNRRKYRSLFISWFVIQQGCCSRNVWKQSTIEVTQFWNGSDIREVGVRFPSPNGVHFVRNFLQEPWAYNASQVINNQREKSTLL